MPDLLLTRNPARIESNRFISAQAPMTRLLLRGADDAIALASKALRFSLPRQPCTSSVDGDRTALWLGPHEQLLLAPETLATEMDALLRHALAGTPHSLVDVGHRQTALWVSGTDVESLLNAGCPLNLHPDSFRVGACSRTVFGKAEIVLWRRHRELFHVEVWRSFAAYVTQLLSEAGRDLEHR